MTELPDWCLALHEEVREWLFSLRDQDHPGRFRFCTGGSLLLPNEKSGLDASALALKIAFMTGILRTLPAGEMERWIDFIRSFQREWEPGMIPGMRRRSGLFVDPEFIRQVRSHSLFSDSRTRVSMAVTRQACAALMCAGSVPEYPVGRIPTLKKDIFSSLDSLDWKRDPWDAGSYASHLVFFYKLNRDHFGIAFPYDPVSYVFEWLNGIRNPDTGSWYRGDPSPEQKINSAMKVLTAYSTAGRPLERAEPLIEFALASVNDSDGCHNTNILFVLHYCSKFTEHRLPEIREFCRQRLEIIRQFRKPDGGFSFYRDHSQDRIYGVRVSKGLPESDIHGTVMFTWALSMISDLLESNDQVPWHLPIN